MHTDNIAALMLISIHAPVKGATAVIVYVVEWIVISIHAPVKGATGEHLASHQKNKFQSTLP